jgi:aspartyl-tRNA(Asn)/glutamyl-tRNA(Gln) amidotransferase subunit B
MSSENFSGFEAVIGLEVHAQLRTRTKIFCGCSTEFDAEVNENLCPVCAGHPGTLPVLNKKAVEFAVRAGLATNCSIRTKSIFARKNYFYPDLPKGYQISQYDKPFAENGFLDIAVGSVSKRIRLQRIHMEEDAGKSIHMTGFSMVNLNRAGTPLIEIVSEPDLRSAEEAGAYLRKLHAILMYTDVCDGNMQEGSFRCDANVSVRPVGASTFGTRAEIKNVNSFRFVEKAIEYEINRQIQVLQSGGRVVQETRSYDSGKNVTVSMRSKEEAHDYRYFPEPDLLPLRLSEKLIEHIRTTMPELPDQKRQRFVDALGIPAYDAQVITSRVRSWRTFSNRLSLPVANPSS